jgi:hypothetical protein
MALSLGDERIHLKNLPLTKQFIFLKLPPLKKEGWGGFKNASVKRIG